MSTMMEGIAPFKTLLGHALVRDEKGQEMHKSTGNAIWFDEAVEKMGADVMRWVYCGQNTTNNLNFGYSGGDQVRRRIFGTWWNVYSFFVNYARLDGYDPAREPVPYDQLQDIDRWLLSKLQVLIKTSNEALSNYNIMTLVQCAEDFIERLSNWYVRRNRRRYWRPKNDSDVDKLAAYQTLYRVLTDMTKIFAPITPFMTEEMYQNLVRTWDTNGPESVHHCDYPRFDEKLFDEKLAGDMDMVADVVNKVLSVRETRQIRVRQPLKRLILVADETDGPALKRFESHILDELNIKELQLADNAGDYVTYEVKCNMKTLGPKFGRDIKTLTGLLAELPVQEVVDSVSNAQLITLSNDEDSWELSPEDIVVTRNFPESLVVTDTPRLTLIVDIEINDELKREGMARDIVRHIQQTRKDTGLEIQNHIKITWQTNDDTLKEAINEHQDYIRSETLCDEMGNGDVAGPDVKEVNITGTTLKLQVEKTC
ncbi:MAG: DUF5915 domain-containing protein, partial [Phycisphaerae bacterium]|nr:DUF5915 domain-containing protein [Phycisphaerae bacterium]